MIRVLLADDHSVVRDGLRRLVDGAGDMKVVAEAADGREAIRKTRESSPDVAVVDISMPGLDGLEVIRQLRLENPKLPVLVLTMHEEEQYVVRAIEAGAMGYITKRSAAEQLLQAIRKVHAGGRSLSESASEALATRRAKGAGARSPLDSLHPGDPGAPGTGAGEEQPGDRGELFDQHEDDRYLPHTSSQEAEFTEQRGADAVRDSERDCGMVVPPAPYRKKNSDVRIKIGPIFRFPSFQVSFILKAFLPRLGRAENEVPSLRTYRKEGTSWHH